MLKSQDLKRLRTRVVGATLLSQFCPLKAKPKTQIKMLSKRAMVGAALLSQLCPYKGSLAQVHKEDKEDGESDNPVGLPYRQPATSEKKFSKEKEK
jgi:hypothetical protein